MEKIKIPFNVPALTGNEVKYIQEVIEKKKYSGDGEFTRRCHTWLESTLGCAKALLTTSGTHALEMAALLIDIKPGDEVIMPSFTFTSTANAFALRGAMIVFVDIRPDTMNMDETLIENAITEKTRAIVPVHYAGVPCEMDSIMDIARRYDLYVVEDAAQAIMSTHKGRYCGTIGHFGCLSFHETKNIHCGEGGALLINDERFIERAEIIREKGTDRSSFYRGEVDKYTWRDIGSSYLPSEVTAAFLWAQLEMAKEITANRKKSWNLYQEMLSDRSNKGLYTIPLIHPNQDHNAHIYFIKTVDAATRTNLVEYMAHSGIPVLFHYIPLHKAPAGRTYCRFHGRDVFTTEESGKILRLPLFYGMSDAQAEEVAATISNYYTL